MDVKLYLYYINKLVDECEPDDIFEYFDPIHLDLDTGMRTDYAPKRCRYCYQLAILHSKQCIDGPMITNEEGWIMELEVLNDLELQQKIRDIMAVLTEYKTDSIHGTTKVDQSHTNPPNHIANPSSKLNDPKVCSVVHYVEKVMDEYVDDMDGYMGDDETDDMDEMDDTYLWDECDKTAHFIDHPSIPDRTAPVDRVVMTSTTPGVDIFDCTLQDTIAPNCTSQDKVSSNCNSTSNTVPDGNGPDWRSPDFRTVTLSCTTSVTYSKTQGCNVSPTYCISQTSIMSPYIQSQGFTLSSNLPDMIIDIGPQGGTTLNTNPLDQAVFCNGPQDSLHNTGQTDQTIPDNRPPDLLHNNGLMDVPVHNTRLTDQPVHKTGQTNRTIPDSRPPDFLHNNGLTDQHVHNIGLTDQPVHKTRLMDQPVHNTGLTDQPVHKTGPTDQTTPDNGPPDLSYDTGLMDKPAHNTVLTDQTIHDIGPMDPTGLSTGSVKHGGILTGPCHVTQMLISYMFRNSVVCGGMRSFLNI